MILRSIQNLPEEKCTNKRSNLYFPIFFFLIILGIFHHLCVRDSIDWRVPVGVIAHFLKHGSMLAMSSITSSGIFPTHFDRLSKFTGSTTWSEECSTFWREMSWSLLNCVFWCITSFAQSSSKNLKILLSHFSGLKDQLFVINFEAIVWAEIFTLFVHCWYFSIPLS